MNVKIITDLSGEMQFDMAEDKVMQLIGAATMYAADSTTNETVTTHWADGEIVSQEVVREPETKKKPTSRVESLFGDYRSRIPISAVMPSVKKNEESYRGFLLIQCDDCGKLRGFYAKTPQTYYFCDCGHETKLENLRPAFINCKKCGDSFKYMTNVKDYAFTYRCLNCGETAYLRLNQKGNAYITEGNSRKV